MQEAPRVRLVQRVVNEVGRTWLLLGAAMLAAVSAAAATKVPCDDVRRLQLNRDAGLVIVDVRPPDEFAGGHIQGARSLPAAVEPGSLPADARVVVYCGEAACALAGTAAQKLLAAGFSDVRILDGGMDEWRKRGFPVTKPRAAVSRKAAAVSARQAREKLADQSLLALDVRPAVEFGAGHLPGARSVPLEDLGAGLATLPKGRELLVYDRSPMRSREAAEKLSAAGLKVWLLSGGIAAWVKAGYPLEVPKP